MCLLPDIVNCFRECLRPEPVTEDRQLYSRNWPHDSPPLISVTPVCKMIAPADLPSSSDIESPSMNSNSMSTFSSNENETDECRRIKVLLNEMKDCVKKLNFAKTSEADSMC